LKTPAEAIVESGHSFSFFSAFSKRSDTTPSTKHPQHSPLPNSNFDIQVNHQLTTLDNSMLEECITHMQSEYGWKVYERMGSVLEDRETAKIAMRLCKRAFLGHGGPGANQQMISSLKTSS
jgi:hypothetical protein